ncbi:MAG: hypothetical protein AAGC70_02930 [Pseudomonadota bacterium]
MSRIKTGLIGIAVMLSASAGIVFAAKVVSPPNDLTSTPSFLGVSLGMTTARAQRAMNATAPGAVVGKLCSGNSGVGSYVNWKGVDWQFMAHQRGGHIDEIRLFRFDHRNGEELAACRRLFTDLLTATQKRFPDLKWTLQQDLSGGYAMNSVFRAHAGNGLTVRVSGSRLDWSGARCATELLLTRRSVTAAITR